MTTQSTSGQEMIKPLTSLRFVFILMIFLHHFSIGIDGGLFPQGGALGVTFFFILSGFVMAFAYKSKIADRQFSYHSFFVKRVSKLYPLHIVCFCAAVLLLSLSTKISGKEILIAVPNILLLQSWIPIKSVYFSYNAVAWFASDMMFFYVMFSLLIKAIHLIAKKKVIIFSTIIVAYFILIQFIPASYQHALLYINPAFRLLDFTIGILLYDIYKWLLNRNMSWFNDSVTGSIFQVVSIILLVGCVFAVKYIPLTYIFASYYWLPVCFVILSFSLFVHGWGYKLLSINILYKLGGLSFSFFLIHQLVFRYWSGVIGHFNISLPWPIHLIITFIITLALSLFCEKYIVSRYAK